MKLEISGNNVVTKAKYVQGIVYKEHAMMPSGESFVIFDTEEQQQMAIDVISQFSNITLKYKNMITVDEAASITDNTEFHVLYQNNVKFINFIETLIYYLGQANSSYILDLTILKYFKNIKIFQVSSVLWSYSPTKIIIDMSNIEEVKKTIGGINTTLLNTDKVTHIYNMSGLVSETVSFPSLEILDSGAFGNSNIHCIKDLGKLTELKNDIFDGCHCFEICLPPTCKTLKGRSFYNCTVNKITGTDYIETFDGWFIFYNVSMLEKLSFKNLTTIINNNGNNIISGCSSLREITSLGKITEFPINFLYNLTHLIYLDIPDTVRILNGNCINLCNIGSSYYRIQNTLDFSRVTTINTGSSPLTNTKGTTIIWPETCTNTSKTPFMSSGDFKNIININYWVFGNTSNNIMDSLTITNYENTEGPYVSTNMSFNTNDDIGTVTFPLSFIFGMATYVKKLTIKTEYITNVQCTSSVTVYQELNLDDKIESIYNITFLGNTLRLPANLKYIRNFSAPNLKYIEYPQNILLKYIYSSFNAFSTSNPYNAGLIIPAEYYVYSYQGGYYNGTILQFAEGVKEVTSSFNGTFPNVQSFIIPSSMVKCESMSLTMSNINILTILSDNFTFKYCNIISQSIKQFNLSNTCETLNILSSSINFSTDILQFPATMTDFFSNSITINAQGALRKIIFNGSTYINADPTLQSNYGSYFYYNGNPATVKEIINVYLPFFYNNRGMFTNIERITIADNMDNSTTLYNNIFNNYKKLKFVKLPNTLERIESEAFYNNVQLQELDIPDTIEYISNYAFGYCSSLRTMIIRTATPPESESANIKHVAEICTIYVPEESVTAYKESPYWIANAAQIQAIPEE